MPVMVATCADMASGLTSVVNEVIIRLHVDSDF
jgi:hypothetical protein